MSFPHQNQILREICYLKVTEKNIIKFSFWMTSQTTCINIMMLGSGRCGKSALVERYVANTFTHSLPTIGIEFAKKKINIPEVSGIVRIWDTAGQERFRSITKTYYKQADGFVLVFDKSRKGTFQDMMTWAAEIPKNVARELPVLLVGNKCDLKTRFVGASLACKFAKKHGMLYFETSAKTGKNVVKAFDSLVAEVCMRNVFSPNRASVLEKRQEVKCKCC